MTCSDGQHQIVFAEALTQVCCLCGLVVDTHTFCDPVSVGSTADEVPRKRRQLDLARADKRDACIYQGRAHIKSMSCLMSTGPMVEELALRLFDDSITKADTKNRYRSCIDLRCASCMYHAMKMMGFDRSEDEVSVIFGVDLKSLRKHNILLRGLLIERPYGRDLLAPISPENLTCRMYDQISQKVDLANVPKYRVLAEVRDNLTHPRLFKNGKKPTNVCAHALASVLCRYNVTPEEIASALRTGLATVTKP